MTNKLLSQLRPACLWMQRHWLQIGLGLFAAYILLQKDITLQLTLNSPVFRTPPALSTPRTTEFSILAPLGGNGSATVSGKKGSPQEQQQLAYVRRFAPVAQQEMKKFGIPASIKLAQGLLESDAGTSPLAKNNNNHFGIKCFSRSCQKGHCSNFLDDSHKDFFRIYKNAWESYRAHSLFLQNKRYESLFRLGPANYRAWAKELARAGYATDPDYPAKLIDLIETLELYRYDLSS